MTQLKDILQQQRKKNFVGRQNETAYFEQLLKENPPPVHLLYIYGPGGQGKTTLLKQFADLCRTASVPCIPVDCHHIEPHPESFKRAYQAASPFAEGDATAFINLHAGTVVLLIDTYEKLKPLDDWVRLEFLPELPGNVITVIAGRQPLSTHWRTDPGWQSISKIFSLQPLNDLESRQLLSIRNIPDEQVGRMVSYTHGNPLALSIVADMFNQRKDSSFDPLDSPDIMKTLLEQFVQEVPSPAHKAALELCSLVHTTTEKLIEEVLGTLQAHELFNWLASLTFIEKGPEGIYPHELARDAIAGEMHWRNPEWYRHLHIITQQFFISRLLKQSGSKQRELLFGLIFLHRLNPAVKPFFTFQETGSTWQDRMKAADREHLTAMVNKYEGNTAAACFAGWLDHEAAEVWVFRDVEKTPAGFVLKIQVDKLRQKTHDPVVNALLPYKTTCQIKKGELMTAFYSWMSRDHYQQVSSVQSAIFLSIVQCYFTPGLAITMLRCVNPGFWRQVLDYADLHHLPMLDHCIDEQNYGWYMHDWRAQPPLAWLELMGTREIGEDANDNRAAPPATIGLTEQKFTDAVYQALKQLNSPKKMTGNVLLKSRFVQQASEGDISEISLALTLADKLTTAIASLKDAPQGESLHRVLYRTFINPVGSQEQTADFLYMSLSTYRRQVKKGVEKIADMLWLEEKRAHWTYIEQLHSI